MGITRVKGVAVQQTDALPAEKIVQDSRQRDEEYPEKSAVEDGIRITLMFIGEYHHIMDEKGRVAVPKKFQKELGSNAVLTRGLDQCLFVFSKKEWMVLAQKLAQLPIAQADARAFSRLMLAGAMDVELDAQGRVMVPEYLRQYGKLKKNVVVAGVYGRMELWDEAGWEAYQRTTEAGSTAIAEHLASLGV